MERSKRKAPGEAPESTAVLLKSFPLDLHRQMRAEAARRGIHVSATYAQACQLFLSRLEQARRKRS